MVNIGRDHWNSSSSTSLVKQDPLDCFTQSCVQVAFGAPGKEGPEPLCPSAQSPSQCRSSSSCTEVLRKAEHSHSPAQWIYFKHSSGDPDVQLSLGMHFSMYIYQ